MGKRATANFLHRAWHHSRDRRQPIRLLSSQHRHRFEKPDRLGMFRVMENFVDRRVLYNPPKVHDRHVVGHLRNDAQVMCDEHDR